MQTEHQFAREDVLPSWWANVVGEVLSLLAHGFQLSKLDDTHIQVVAGADDAAAIISVHGRWRWIEATVSRAHPGGAAGTWDIFVTAVETNIQATPAPYTDDTVYAFALAIVAHNATPPIVAGTVDVFRKVGELQWDGAKITRIDQFVPVTSLHAHRHATGQPDAIAPADIGAAAEADLVAETARAEAAESALSGDFAGAELLAHKDAANGYAGLDATGHLKNSEKRKIVPVAQSATPAVNIDVTDMAEITGLAEDVTNMSTNLTGTPDDDQVLIFKIADDGTARAINWGPSFEASPWLGPPPNRTIAGEVLFVAFMWIPASSKFRCVGYG